MSKRILRYVAPVALALGLTGALGAGVSGAATHMSHPKMHHAMKSHPKATAAAAAHHHKKKS